MGKQEENNFLQAALDRYKQRSIELKKREGELRHRLEVMQSAMPDVLNRKVRSASAGFKSQSRESHSCNCSSGSCSTPERINTKDTSRKNWADDSCSCLSELVSEGNQQESCYCLTGSTTKGLLEDTKASTDSKSRPCSGEPTRDGDDGTQSDSDQPLFSSTANFVVTTAEKEDADSGAHQQSSSDAACACSEASMFTCAPTSRQQLETPKERPSSPCICSEEPTSPAPESSGCSLHSDDFACMKKLQQLVDNEKQMQSQIEDMRQQERAFLSALRPPDPADDSRELERREEAENTRRQEIAVIKRIEDANERLMNENERLIDELKDLKFNLKYCMENVQGPLSRQLDREKRRAQQLEAQLCDKTVESNAKLCTYVKQINRLKGEICSNSEKLYEIDAGNERLEGEICEVKGKYRVLQKALVGEKIKEAETLSRIARCGIDCDC